MKKATQQALDQIKQQVNEQFKSERNKKGVFVQLCDVQHELGKVNKFILAANENKQDSDKYGKYFIGTRNQIAKLCARLVLLLAYLNHYFDDEGQPVDKKE